MLDTSVLFPTSFFLSFVGDDGLWLLIEKSKNKKQKDEEIFFIRLSLYILLISIIHVMFRYDILF